MRLAGPRRFPQQQLLIGEADGDEAGAETDEGQGPQQAFQPGHVDQESLADRDRHDAE